MENNPGLGSDLEDYLRNELSAPRIIEQMAADPSSCETYWRLVTVVNKSFPQQDMWNVLSSIKEIHATQCPGQDSRCRMAIFDDYQG